MKAQYRTQSGFLIAVCEEDLVGNATEELRAELQTRIKEGELHGVVLDLKGCRKTGREFLRFVSVMAQELRRSEKRFFAIHVSPEVSVEVELNGLSSSLTMVRAFSDIIGAQEAQQATPQQKVKLDAGFVNPFIQGTLTTLGTQCSTSAKPGKPFLKGPDFKGGAEIAGIIGLTSSSFNGSIILCFSSTTFLNLMSKMLGEKYETITQDLEDGASELLNIIFGQAKVKLNEGGYKIEKAIPTVVRGKDISIRHPALAATLVVPFESDCGAFWIEIAIENIK